MDHHTSATKKRSHSPSPHVSKHKKKSKKKDKKVKKDKRKKSKKKSHKRLHSKPKRPRRSDSSDSTSPDVSASPSPVPPATHSHPVGVGSRRSPTPPVVPPTVVPPPRRKPTPAEIAAARAGVAKQRAVPTVIQSRDDYEQQQSVVRRVYDPDTGRMRLVKGDGEILEEIVSKDRQRQINKMATQGDGAAFQNTVAGLLKKGPS
eukprot:m.115983 g.115983  ORF g.115983 m.115983 type:complete len:204 (+) comp10898_c1_seq2:568-1179(+)